MRPWSILSTAAALALLMAGCAPGSSGGPEDVPDVEVQNGDQVLWLRPSSACWSFGCFDGPRPDPLESAGTSTELSVRFPKPNWEFSALLTQDLDACQPRELHAQLTSNRDGTWNLQQQGPAGDWVVDVFGFADGEGDVASSFTWTTSADGELPPARGTLIALADHDVELDSYGIEFFVAGLEHTPLDALASVSVSDSAGQEFVVEVPRSGDAATCGTAAGSASFRFSDSQAQDRADELVTALGDGPYAYRVDLTLDGVTYQGRGSWPAGAEERSLEVDLTFSPPLPAWDGD